MTVALPKLGKLPARYDSRTLRLARYLTSALPEPPEARDWSAPLSTIGMMGNDRLGDCTCAGAAHLIQTWTATDAAAEVTVPDADVIAAYSAITGYTPSDPTSDRGACLLDVLQHWRAVGVGGHTIGAYVAVGRFGALVTNPTPIGPLIDEIKLACNLFGGLYTGVMLPAKAMDDVSAGRTWDVSDNDGETIGGHCMALVGYDAEGVTYLTWGQRQRATWAWVAKYADEMFALLSPDWVSGAKSAPSGFALATLQADIAQIGAAA